MIKSVLNLDQKSYFQNAAVVSIETLKKKNRTEGTLIFMVVKFS